MNKGNIALLLIVWAFFLVLGHLGLNIPTLLIVLGSLLMLFQ